MMQIEQQYLNLNGARMNQPPPEATVPPPPVVICPTEVDSVNITLEKNQQCACKDCGKLFNSVWYLKQHAVKHSNDRPFRCKFCYKTYKFRSNLYQHKCPDRIKNGNTPFSKRLMCRLTVNQSHLLDSRPSSIQQQHQQQHLQVTQRIVPPETGQFYSSNGPRFPLSHRMAEQNPERAHIPVEAVAPEALSVQQQIELRDDVVPKRFLEQDVIDNYLQKNKHKLYQCRKCKQQFPTRGYLSRHTAQHSELDQLPAQCDLCPQRFSTDLELRKHMEQHSKDSGIVCIKCCASFRSMLALRRHRNQSRQCEFSPTVYSIQTFDEYAYIDAAEARAQMSTTGTGNGTNGENDEDDEDDKSVQNNDESFLNSRSDYYEHYASDNPTRPEEEDNESGLAAAGTASAYENGSKRTVKSTKVKIKLGSTPVVSILKTTDEPNSSNNNEQQRQQQRQQQQEQQQQQLHKNRSSYPELDDIEATNSEAAPMDTATRRRQSFSSIGGGGGGGAFDISRNGRFNEGSSCTHSGRSSSISHHHTAMSSNGGGGSNSTQTIGSGDSSGDVGTSDIGTTGTESQQFTSSGFDSFPASSDIYDGLVLEGGRPLILHTQARATKGTAATVAVVPAMPSASTAAASTLELAQELDKYPGTVLECESGNSDHEKEGAASGDNGRSADGGDNDSNDDNEGT